MNSIAVLLDNDGDTSSWLDNGIIKLYKKTNNKWMEVKSLPYSISTNCTIISLGKSLSELVEKLDNCKIFVAREVSGLLFSILDSYCFDIYELNGIPDTFLDCILISQEKDQIEKLKREELLLTSQPGNNSFPEIIDKHGNYAINLRKILQRNSTFTSKQILIPFLEKETFKSLKVIFDHVPKWFEKDLANMGYNFDIATCKNDITSILIYPKSK